MKPPKSRKAELASDAKCGRKSRAEAADGAECAEFKMTELGPIPVDWEVKRLGDVCSITTGHKDVNQGCKNGKYPFFTCSRNVFTANSYSFDCEAILVAGNGDVGNLHYYKGKFEAYQRTYVLKDFSEDVSYILHELTYNLMRCLSDGKIGSSIPYITIQQLEGFMYPLPPLAEQRRIAGALSDVDELISALGKLIEKKRNIKTGAMQQLLTGKTRLPGFGAKRTEFKQTELGSIPVDWEVKRLGDVVNILDNRRVPLSESQRKSGTFPYCGANGIVDYIDRYEFDEESILIAEDGGNFSDFANRAIAYKMSGKYWVNNHAHVLTAKAGCDLDYLLFHLSHKDITDIISGGTRAKLTRGQLENIIISLPPLAEHKAIAAVLSDMDAEIAALESDRAKYERIKSGMMQELLTGKTRLV